MICADYTFVNAPLFQPLIRTNEKAWLWISILQCCANAFAKPLPILPVSFVVAGGLGHKTAGVQMSLAKPCVSVWNDHSIYVSIPQASFLEKRGRSLVFDQGDKGDNQATEPWRLLMARVLQGDSGAYAQLLNDITPFVKNQVRRYHSDPETVEDVLQETLLTIHRVRHTYEEGRSVHNWVAAIARRRSIDALRFLKRHRVGRESIEQIDLPDDRANHEEKMAAGEQVAAALQSLPAAQREAIRLLKLEEYSLKEASQLSGQSILALKSLVYRAMKTLRHQVGRGPNEE